MLNLANHSKYIFERELLNYLADKEVLSSEVIAEIREELLAGSSNLDVILTKYLSAKEVMDQKSEFLGIKSISLRGRNIEKAIIALIPEELAGKYSVIPLALLGDRLQVAISNPTDLSALDNISIYTGFQVEPLLAEIEEIKVAIRENYTVQRTYDGQASEFGLAGLWKIEEELSTNHEGPAVKLVDSLFRQAVLEKASDIHWEPTAKDLTVKFRLDGALTIKASLPRASARIVASRLKIMAGMDVTERRIPQDGRIMLDFPGKTIDIRVSTLATVYGEKVVTRILDAETAQRSLSELGMREDVEKGVRKLLQQPHGLILISGPTGSGKTTTLYALLREVQSEALNIVSIEDPVEYRLPGVNQAQVNQKIGLDFAGGLRAILRQDPDIIMVGEIRDRDTARIATAAALTGHLVFTTVHTNTAAEALARLLDMDIEPYLLASAVCGVLSQRLVRKLCPYCKEVRNIGTELTKTLEWEPSGEIYGPKGCTKCQGSGYSGRIGVHEYLPYNSKIKELVIQKNGAKVLEQTSRSLGILSLLDDALLKVDAGITSLEEVIRLAAGV
ncbi:MAG: pilus assembly protein PilB [Gracilibacter sp. BRH_c7a]|nr:MAG: pilus assembly protein PilB [Gracilibacter sp. BRH_c7a]